MPNNQQLSNAIRFLAIDAVQQANSGHPGMPMGMADVATVLYKDFLRFNPQMPNWHNRDRFILSAGHGSMLLYALLYLTGYDGCDIEQIKNFRQLGFKTAGHPEYGHLLGIETTTGPLGQGLANGVGMALSERMLNARFGDEIVNHHTYVIAGDGCLMEGISQEAISFAGHLNLANLIVLFDDNGITIDGATSLSTSENTCARFEACGFDTQQIDGHDSAQIHNAIAQAKKSNKPSLICCKTHIGYGSPSKQDTAKAHGAPLGADEIALVREKLNWASPPFEIPADILQAWRDIGAQHVETSEQSANALANLSGDKKQLWQSLMVDNHQQKCNNAIQNLKQEWHDSPPEIASRKASETVLNVLFDANPRLLGGSADLTGSNNTRAKNHQAIDKDNYGGDYLNYGIREHGMAAIMNGISLHGCFIPYGGTFLVFSDYMRPSIRLSALMKQKVIYVLTHDSIGVGEDGPTHQPVEHVPALRTIPDLLVLRPADAIETAECWQIALDYDGASALILTRQNLTPINRDSITGNASQKGGYVVQTSNDTKVTLLATGSEVPLAIKASALLEADGINCHVVSIPCMELFNQLSKAQRDEILGNVANPRFAIEAAIPLGWSDYGVLPENMIAMQGFGASGPGNQVFDHFGFTAEKVAGRVKEALR